jgi:hypothetical protein
MCINCPKFSMECDFCTKGRATCAPTALKISKVVVKLMA